MEPVGPDRDEGFKFYSDRTKIYTLSMRDLNFTPIGIKINKFQNYFYTAV